MADRMVSQPRRMFARSTTRLYYMYMWFSGELLGSEGPLPSLAPST